MHSLYASYLFFHINSPIIFKVNGRQIFCIMLFSFVEKMSHLTHLTTFNNTKYYNEGSLSTVDIMFYIININALARM